MDINLTDKFLKRMGAKTRQIGRYNASELYFVNSGDTTPEEWLHPTLQSVRRYISMWAGSGMHQQIQELYNGGRYTEEKREFKYKDITLVAKADYLPTDKSHQVWEFKTSELEMTRSKPWQAHQAKLLITIFDRQEAIIYQPVYNNDGVYLKGVETIKRDDDWFEKQLEKLYEFHLKVVKLQEEEERQKRNVGTETKSEEAGIYATATQ